MGLHKINAKKPASLAVWSPSAGAARLPHSPPAPQSLARGTSEAKRQRGCGQKKGTEPRNAGQRERGPRSLPLPSTAAHPGGCGPFQPRGSASAPRRPTLREETAAMSPLECPPNGHLVLVAILALNLIWRPPAPLESTRSLSILFQSTWHTWLANHSPNPEPMDNAGAGLPSHIGPHRRGRGTG
jgi:hypothetical protein